MTNTARFTGFNIEAEGFYDANGPLSNGVGLDDYVVSGFVYPTTSASLTLTATGGVAVVGGKTLTVPARTYTYPANSTIVEELQSDGIVSRTLYASYVDVPADPPSGLRLALIVTGASVVNSAAEVMTRQSMLQENMFEAGLLWQKLLGELEVTTGPYAGAYRYSVSNNINWYFANTGLWYFAHLIPAKIKTYLNLYIATCDPTNWWIQDVQIDGSDNFVAFLDPDSTDSYAAGFIRLAIRYVRLTGDWTWWNANLAAIKNIALYNIRLQFKPSPIPGLTRAISNYYPYKVYDVAYLLDNCECYASMNELATMLEFTGDADAADHRTDADFMLLGLANLWDSTNNVWFYADDLAPPKTAWYPYLVCQIGPEFWGYHSTPTIDFDRFNFAYEYLNANAPQWWNRKYDGFPWLLIGYYAIARRGDATKAAAQLEFAKRYFLWSGGRNSGAMTINDLGYAQAIRDALVNPLAIDADAPIPIAGKTFLGGLRTAGGSTVLADTVLPTTARTGFMYVPTCAGTPTGVPIAEPGTIPMVVDATNNILYGYINSAWRAL